MLSKYDKILANIKIINYSNCGDLIITMKYIILIDNFTKYNKIQL